MDEQMRNVRMAAAVATVQAKCSVTDLDLINHDPTDVLNPAAVVLNASCLQVLGEGGDHSLHVACGQTLLDGVLPGAVGLQGSV